MGSVGMRLRRVVRCSGMDVGVGVEGVGVEGVGGVEGREMVRWRWLGEGVGTDARRGRFVVGVAVEYGVRRSPLGLVIGGDAVALRLAVFWTFVSLCSAPPSSSFSFLESLSVTKCDGDIAATLATDDKSETLLKPCTSSEASSRLRETVKAASQKKKPCNTIHTL